MPAISEKSTQSPAERFYTNAPTDYDWAWTHTVIANVAVDSRNRPVRLVEISDGWHADYQAGRYASGLHFAFNEEQYKKEVEMGFLTPTPEEEIHFFSKEICITAAIYDEKKNRQLRPYAYKYQKGKDYSICFEYAGRDHVYQLTVQGKKDEAEATFNRLVNEIEAICKG